MAVIRATGSGPYAESTLTTEGGWLIYLPLLLRDTPYVWIGPTGGKQVTGCAGGLMNHRNLVVLPILMLGLFTGGLLSVGTPPAAEGQDLESSGPMVVRIWVKDRDHLNAVAGELDIWECHPTKGYAVVAVRPEQVQWLQELGYALEVDAEKQPRCQSLAPLDPRFHYFDDYQTNANSRYVVDFLRERQRILSRTDGTGGHRGCLAGRSA